MEDHFVEAVETAFLDFATDKRLEWENKHLLYSVIFEITPRCNFNCVHCYLTSHHDNDELSYEEIIEIIDILYEKEVLFLTFTGGDVFVRKDFKDIYLYAKKKGFIIEIYTNGALIDQEILDMFCEYPPLLVDISLYGSCEDTYHKVTGVSNAFAKVVHSIEELKRNNIRVSLKAPILNLYYDELPAMKKIAENYGLPFRTGFEIFPTIDNDSSVTDYSVPIETALEYEFAQFEEEKHNMPNREYTKPVDLMKEKPLFRCKLGRASCVIDYYGNMCPCMSFRHRGVRLTKDNFESVWNSFGQYPEMKADDTYRCLQCEAYDYCDICPAMMEFVYGDMQHVDEHFCRSAKARYQHFKKMFPEV